MPGIYLRKTSWIDWTQKEKNQTLTVPGSYWLCHKTNIYKFIFRYHRTNRNIKQFNYGKELMKVIRKIIKNPPSQKQQFGTSHLLITFEHTPWTRQDKMFALMKFRERSVVAFSYAFILTITPIDSLRIEQNSENIISSDRSLIYQNESSNDTYERENKNEKESKKCLKHSSKDDSSKTDAQCNNMQEILGCESKNIQANNNIGNTNLKKLLLNEETVKQTGNSEDTNKFCKHLNMSPKHSIKLNDKMNESNVNCLEDSNIKHQLSDDKIKINNCNIGKDKNNSVSNNSKMLNNSSVVDDINTDSVNLPYQYLIEKEIEATKQNMLELNAKDITNHIEAHSDITKIQDLSCPKKKSYVLDNVPRSSDITDLVMEGLMFTIRQDQDTVAVIEQKTKLEIDEVLENSEKIETKEGEKCLRNSSLLGLENLITMLELPKGNEPGDIYQNIDSQKPTLRNQSMRKHLLNNVKYPLTNNKIKEQNSTIELKHMQWYPFNNSISASTSYSNNDNIDITNKRRYSEIYDNSKDEEDAKFIKYKNLKYEEEEEEDIIPEALQNETCKLSTLSLKADKSKDKLNFIPNKDLLMNDVNNEESIKYEIDKDELKSSFNNNLHPKKYTKSDCPNSVSIDSQINKAQKLHNNAVCESKFHDTNKYKSNVPVIISNQIISLNEIPLPLQKILKNKLKHNSLNDKTKINKDNIEIHETQPGQNASSISSIQLKNQILNSHTETSSKDHEKFVQDSRKTYNENISSSILKTEEKCSNSSKNIMELNEEKSQNQNNYIDKTRLSSNKIKDVTQEFYKQFSHLQKEKALTNQKRLRSSRKSLNYANNGEMHIQMAKFFQDITRGAKVVVTRIRVNKYS
ncbi:myb-like protein D isoform X1 [Bombus vosnesenskii]|uniref:Myb-like protein D isoform X1 n=1 Tax=Bombus vosnesenskii TaxID=207650 RepID=A0A6J3KU75_9HYME|nr:myb-like protein D isoform X1 [Bombus vosnesenskii]XP_033355692.1 myb-like protein D isoform X1 [Bombus vosnesenskii]